MGLQKYKKKRKFTATPEPEGVDKHSSGSLSFVIQKHQASRLHYDFRLEMDGVMKSWAVPKGPSTNTGDKRLAMMVEDHPYDYKNFEGVIPAGNYGAGTVMIWDEGEYHALETSDPDQSEKVLKKGLRDGMIKFFLKGKKLQGRFALIKLKNYKGKESDNSWLLIKEKDDYVIKADITKNDTSARTGRTLEEIAEGKTKIWESNKKSNKKSKVSNAELVSASKEKDPDIRQDYSGLLQKAPKAKMPHQIKPMLATLTDKPFDSEDWLFEVKWDGYRAVAELQKNQVKIYSRNLLSFNELFAPIVKTLNTFEFNAILDGEVVIVDKNGRASFQLLQNYLPAVPARQAGQNTGQGNLTYYIFDILYYKDRDLREIPLVYRKKILKEILPPAKNVKYSDHILTAGVDFFDAAKAKGLEGIIAKTTDSIYASGRRSMEWLKIKTSQRQEVVIGGFTEPRGGRKKFGALVLGVYQGDDLVYVGHTGSGFNDKNLGLIHDKLKPLIISKSPFKVPPKTNAPVTWVKPVLVGEINFSEWTGDGSMRHPIFAGLRVDKKPKEVVKETPTDMGKTYSKEKVKSPNKEVTVKVKGRELKLTNLDKVYWPKEKYTKGDLVDYYKKIAPFIMPYLKDRAENLNRHPNGIEGPSFYQKNMEHQPPKWVKTKKIFSESNDAYINYLVCQDEPTLLYMANLGCIEINPWNSRINKLSHPDYAIIDLDPEAIGFDRVVEAALTTHKILEDLNVPNYCKTSGATGLHIFIPLGAKYEYELAKQFAQLIATLVNTKLPKTTSLERSPKKRQKRIYLDYLQNRKGQTLAAPYSVRPKPGATVSTPLEWKEVNQKLDPKNFTMETIFKRLDKQGDLWKPVLGKGVDIKKIINKLA
jgi:bifunctional non-homologous end joining protein LigD